MLTVPLFALLGTGWVWLIILVEIAFGILLNINDGNWRRSSLSSSRPPCATPVSALAFNSANALLGGNGSVVATWLIAVTGSNAAPAWYLTVIAIGHSAPCSWRRKPL